MPFISNLIISLFVLFCASSHAEDVGVIPVFNLAGQETKLVVSQNPAEYKCTIHMGVEALHFDLEVPGKPYGRSYSPSWIGVIDYSSGNFKLYPRTLIKSLCVQNAASLKVYKTAYRKLHPFWPNTLDHKDFMILPWLMKNPVFSAKVYSGSVLNIRWLSN